MHRRLRDRDPPLYMPAPVTHQITDGLQGFVIQYEDNDLGGRLVDLAHNHRPTLYRGLKLQL